MSKVEELIPNLREMSPEELRDKIREIRKERKTPKRKASSSSSSSPSSKKNPLASIKKMLEKMSPEEKKTLLENMKK